MKLPRDVSGAQAGRVLQRLGFSVLRQRGSHIRMGKGAFLVTVPAPGSINPGTLQSILRQAGISLDEFPANL